MKLQFKHATDNCLPCYKILIQNSLETYAYKNALIDLRYVLQKEDELNNCIISAQWCHNAFGHTLKH